MLFLKESHAKQAKHKNPIIKKHKKQSAQARIRIINKI
jgi:hypothetical protein